LFINSILNSLKQICMRKGIITVLAAILALFSCTKSGDKPAGSHTTDATGALSGFWFGTFSAGNEGQVFNADGSTVEYDFYGTTSTDTATCPYKAYGTYTLVGDSLHFNVTYPTLNESFTESAVIDTTVKPFTIAGSYSGSQSGTFSISKQ
jgi:hypothetical protein